MTHCELLYYKNVQTIRIVSKDGINGGVCAVGEIPKNKKVIGNDYIGRGAIKSDLLQIIEGVFLES